MLSRARTWLLAEQNGGKKQQRREDDAMTWVYCHQAEIEIRVFGSAIMFTWNT